MKTLTVRMAWQCGGAKRITCSEAMTVEEIARENGFIGLAARDPLFISRGWILAAEITLHGNRVQDGQTPVAYLPRAARARPIQAEALTKSPRSSPLRNAPTLEEIERLEAGRAADRDFARWETHRRYPLVLAALVEFIEAEEEPWLSASHRGVTVVRPAAGISDTPLPVLAEDH
jgi:hypothetical protein